MANQSLFEEVKGWKKPLHMLRALLARNYLKILPNLEIIAITGSVGKTLTQNALFFVLSQKFKTVVGEENLDPTFRIPKTILSAKPWDQKLILEYGVEHPHDMDYYLKIAKPEIAVVTLIAPTHLKYFKSIQGVFAEKSKLIKAVPQKGTVFLNSQDKYLKKIGKELKTNVVWFGPNVKGQVKISHFSQSPKGSSFRLHYKSQKATVHTKIIGRHQLVSAYIAAAMGLFYGLTLKQIAKGLSQTSVPLHRLNTLNKGKLTIIDDSYNSSPQAVLESLKTLIEIGKGIQKTAVLGEMKDLGDYAKEAHQNIGRKFVKTSINSLITVGLQAQEIANSARKAGFKGQIIKAKNTKEATFAIIKKYPKRKIVLIKGSRHAHLERIVNGLLGRSTVIDCYHCGRLN